MWGLAAAAFVKGNMSILSNAEQGDRYSAMARQRKRFAHINARNVWQAGQRHAAMVEGLGRWQSAMEWLAGQYQADATMSRAEYNIVLSEYTSEYNAQLYEQEAQDIWNQLDLDLYHLRMARASERGDITTGYAHAGVELNSMDTPATTLMDSKTMEEMDATIISHNAEVKAGKALDAAAMSRWEGRTLRAQMVYEAQLEASTTLMNSYSRASSIALQSFMDAQMTRFNAGNRADSLLYDAYYDIYNYGLSENYHRNYGMRWLEGFMGGGGGGVLGGLAAK